MDDTQRASFNYKVIKEQDKLIIRLRLEIKRLKEQAKLDQKRFQDLELAGQRQFENIWP
jgi:predicted FMN-binding regulatory protein PaiB